MLTSLRLSQSGNQEFVASVQDLFLSTSRTIIIVAGGVYLALIFATVICPRQIALNIWVIAPASLGIFMLAYHLMPRFYLASHLLFLSGLLVSITLAISLFQIPEIGYLYITIPLIVVVCLGRRGVVLAQILVFGLIYWLYHGLAPVPPPLSLGVMLSISSIFVGMLGWASMQAVLTVTAWSLSSLRQAQNNLQDARYHRGQLAQAVKELDSANIRLERLNRMLVLARADAEEAREARNRFALSVSHELRTPLNFIISFSEIMVNSPDTYAPLNRWPAMLYDDIQEIYKSSQHLMRLVNDILDLGRLENLQMNLVKEWVGLPQVIGEVVGMMQHAFDLKGLELHVELDDDLPEVFIDRTRIRQVLLNLVNNSLRFTDQGHVTIRVALQDENLQRVCVEDSGAGIPADQLPLLFSEFQQVNREGWYKQEGFGLGLPISKRFVELHNGQMWVESESGQGTRFYFTLPALASAVFTQEAAKSSDERYWQSLEVTAQKGSSILIVSPRPDAVAALAPLMGGMNLMAATPQDDLTARLAAWLPQAIILDQSAATDPELQHQLTNLPYDLPRISLRLPNQPEREMKLPECIHFVFVKPVASRVLADAILSLGQEIRRVLVVADDAQELRLLQRALRGSLRKRSGFELLITESDLDALDAARHQPPDAVVIDLKTPTPQELNILKMAQDLKIPVILITGDEWPQSTSQSAVETLSVQVQRPFSRSELTQVLANLLQVIRPQYPKDLSELAPAANSPG